MCDVRIRITIEEWRMVTSWLYRSLAGEEHSPYGHLLLECDGTDRTWVATDTNQMGVVRTTGPAPRGTDGPFSVRINPRLFRNRPAQDATLVVTTNDDHRMLSLDTDDVRSTIPEHPGDREPWEPVVGAVGGWTGVVDIDRFREAVATAMVVPFGIEPTDSVATWIHFESGEVVLRTGWLGLPPTLVTVPAVVDGTTEPVLVDAARLHTLIDHLDLDHVEVVLPVDGRGSIAVFADAFTGVLAPIDPLGALRDQVGERLGEFLGTDDLEPDEHGDFLVATPEGDPLRVRLLDGDQVTVRFTAVLADPVEPSAELFEELNAINATVRHLRVVHRDSAVHLDLDCDGDELDDESVTRCLRTIRTTGQQYRDLLGPFFVPSDA